MRYSGGMEKMLTYLDRHNIKKSAFAARAGVAVSTFSEIIHGKYIPALEVAVKIERATDGEVACKDWLSS